MTDVVTREATSWTNVSGDEPDWMGGWSYRPSATTLDVQNHSNLVLSEIAQALLTARPRGVYRVVYSTPRSFATIYRDFHQDVIPRSEHEYVEFPILLAFHHMSEAIGSGFLFRALSPAGASQPGLIFTDALLAPSVALASFADDDENAAVLQMVDDVRSWLDLTYDELASISGVSRGALFYWRAQNASPRPSTTRRIARVHALADLLIRHFGPAGARSWLTAGEPSALDLLLSQDLVEVERRARDSLFSQPDLRPSVLHGVGDLPEVNVLRAGERPRRASRKPKRGISQPK